MSKRPNALVRPLMMLLLAAPAARGQEPPPAPAPAAPQAPAKPATVQAPGMALPAPMGSPALAMGLPEPAVGPGGGAPSIAVAEGIDDAGRLTIRMTAWQQLSDQDLERLGAEPAPPGRRGVARSQRFLVDLAGVRLFDQSGRPVADPEQLRRWFAEPRVVLLGDGPTREVDPAYLAAFQPGVPLVFSGPSPMAPIGPYAAPLPEYFGQAEIPAIAPRGVTPRVIQTRGVDAAGMLAVQTHRFAMKPVIRTRMVSYRETIDGRVVQQSEPFAETVMKPALEADVQARPLDAYQGYDLDGRRLSDEELRSALAAPGVALVGTRGMPIEPGYLAAARPGTVVLVEKFAAVPAKSAPMAFNDPMAGRPIPPVADQPPFLEGDVRAAGMFGFPQAEAAVLHDDDGLRVSAWNDAEHLYVQAVIWGDDSNWVGPVGQYNRRWSDHSELIFDLDDDPKVASRGDQAYMLNVFPFSPGVDASMPKQDGTWGGFKPRGPGRGAVRYVRTPEGKRVRVDSVVIPLDLLGKKPGDSIRLAFRAISPVPDLALASVSDPSDGATFHTLDLADRPASLDPELVPDGRQDPPLGPNMSMKAMPMAAAPAAPPQAPPAAAPAAAPDEAPPPPPPQ